MIFEKLQKYYGIGAILFSTISIVLNSYLPIFIFFSICFMLLLLSSSEKPFRFLANWITLSRFMTVFILGFSFYSKNSTLLFGLGGVIVFLDVIDGWVARRFNHKTSFGAVFDAEVDALFVLVCSIGFYMFYNLPIWILFMGFVRYIYDVFGFFLIKNKHKTSERRSIYAILAGIVFIGILISFILEEYRITVLAISNIVLLYSFSRSFYFDYLKV